MDEFMEKLMSSRRNSGDSIWSSFCSKDKGSVKLISRNGINTQSTKPALTKENIVEMLRFSDKDIPGDNFNRNREVPKLGSHFVNEGEIDLGELLRPKSGDKVTQLKLSPDKKPQTANFPPGEVYLDVDDGENSENDTETQYRDTPSRINHPLPIAIPIVDLDISEMESPQRPKYKSPIKKVEEKPPTPPPEAPPRNPYLEIAPKLNELREKIIFNLEDIKSALLPCNQVIETDEIEIVKQKKRSLGFGMRFSRNHLYQISRLIDEIRFTEAGNSLNAKILSLHNSIFQAAITFLKGTANFLIIYAAEKLRDFSNLVMNAMKVEKCYNDEDEEGKNHGTTIIELCNSVKDDLKSLAKEIMEKRAHEIAKKEKKKSVKNLPPKPNPLSMYTSSSPVKKPRKCPPKNPRVVKKIPKKQETNPKPENKENNTQEPKTELAVKINDKTVNTQNLQEALLAILREMTKQQMQQIFRPVLSDIEMLIKNKETTPKDKKSTNELMKRINEFLFSHDETTTPTKVQENTEDDKKLEPTVEKGGKIVQETCDERSKQNKYLARQTLAGQVQKDKLEFLQRTLSNPLYGNEMFAEPWKVVSNTADNILTEMTEQIIKEEMLQNVEGFVNEFLKVEMLYKREDLE